MTADTPSRRTSSLPEVNEAPYLLETLHLECVEWVEMIPLIRSAYTNYCMVGWTPASPSCRVRVSNAET